MLRLKWNRRRKNSFSVHLKSKAIEVCTKRNQLFSGRCIWVTKHLEGQAMAVAQLRPKYRGRHSWNSNWSLFHSGDGSKFHAWTMRLFPWNSARTRNWGHGVNFDNKHSISWECQSHRDCSFLSPNYIGFLGVFCGNLFSLNLCLGQSRFTNRSRLHMLDKSLWVKQEQRVLPRGPIFSGKRLTKFPIRSTIWLGIEGKQIQAKSCLAQLWDPNSLLLGQ